jgi:MFS family permease
MGTSAQGNKGAFIDVFSVLKHNRYRRYWLGLLATVFGFQIMMIAQSWLIYDLTNSKMWLGYAGLAAGIPAIALNLFGGVVADKVNQRKLIISTQTISALMLLILGSLVLLEIIVPWHVLVIAFCIGSVQAFDNPSRQAIFPQLIDMTDMMKAVALNSMVWQGTRIVGPAIGGIIIATKYGTSPGFFVGALGFVTMSAAMATIKGTDSKKPSTGKGIFQDMMEGIQFIRHQPVFLALIGLTFFNSIFGMSYITLLPVFAKDILEIGSSGLGYLHAISGIGGIVGTLLTTRLSKSIGRGKILSAGAISFGFCLSLFAVSSATLNSIPLSALFIFLAGISSSLYMITIMSTLQIMVPNELRGRVMGIYGMTFNLIPIGAMQAGFIAEQWGASTAVIVGGIAVMLFAIVVQILSKGIRNLGVA